MKLRAMPESRDADTTDDAVLGGRLRLRQPRRGHRVGHDAILLAAATYAQAGDHVIDLGAGVGAAGLALLARVPGTTATLVEIDPELAALAADNIARNGYAGRARALALDVSAGDAAFATAGLAAGSADCVMMNPPFNDPARQTVSPDPRRRAAHTAIPEALTDWINVASHLLRAAGTLTVVWRAAALNELLAALTPRFGGTLILPVHGRADQPAIRVIVAAIKAGRASLVTLPPLNLNDAAGRPTAAAEHALRDAEPLALASAINESKR